MKMPRQSCKVLMAIGLLAGVGLSDEKPPVPSGQSTKTPKTTKAQSKSLPEQRAWEEALGQVKLLAAKFQEYRDKAVASKSLAGLASEVCQHDKNLAPVFFHQALDLVKAGLKTSEVSGDKEQLWAARAVVISSAAQCDPQLVEQLNRDQSGDEENEADPKRYWSDLLAANKLLKTNESSSIQFAEGVSQQIPHFQEQQLSFFYGFLWNLRQQAPAAADRIFLQALAQLRQNPASAVRALGVLANYVFGPAGGENTDMLAVMPFGKVNDYNVYFFQAQRAGATPAAVEAYLQTAAQVLATLSPDGEKEAGVAHTLAQQLLQRSLEVAPDLAPEYQTSAERLSPLFPEGELRSRVSTSLATQAGEYERQLEVDLEKSTDPRQRDRIRLSLFAIRWAGREVLKAEKLAAAVEDDELKTQLLSLVAFRNAEIALAKKDLELAQLHSRSLKSPLHRALVFLSIAQQSQQQKDRESATAFLNSAVREIETIDSAQHPYLLVCAATVASALDVQFSLRILEDAIASLNRLDARSAAASGKPEASSKASLRLPEPIFASSRGIVEFATAGDVRQHFDLRIAGLSFDVSDTAKALHSSPPEHLTAALFSLQSEARQGPALAAAAAAYLQRAKSFKPESSRN
jgi:hypothetical protein